MSGGVLGRAALLARLAVDPPLVGDLADTGTQVQPHGIDLRLESVWRLAGAGAIGRDGPGGDGRALPDREAVAFDGAGAVHLATGAYLVRFEEVVYLPTDVMALARPRSTLLRCGAALHTAVCRVAPQRSSVERGRASAITSSGRQTISTNRTR